MKNSLRKHIAILICAALLIGMFATGAAAAEKPGSKAVSFLYDVGDFAAKALIKGITLLFPDFRTPFCFPDNDDFYPGMEAFEDLPSLPEYDTWELGFAQASLTDAFSGAQLRKFYVTGALDVIGKRNVSEIHDPPMIRATALSDGSGRGTVLFLSIDAFGITSTDVLRVRAALREFAADNDIISINVSVLHQHSVVDTLGMNGNLIASLFLNPLFYNASCLNPFSGKDPAYMANLYQVSAQTAQLAVEDMRPGKLFYGKADVEAYITDKRPPVVFDKYAHRLRFAPNDTTKPETWLCNFAIHTTGTGIVDTRVTGDFPAYTALEINEKRGANFQLILGAQLAIGINYNEAHWPRLGDSYRSLEVYGRDLAEEIMGITGETPLPALLNIAHKQLTLPIDNPLHLLLTRLGVIESTVRRTNALFTRGEGRTEIGYMELGDTLAFALVPGELEPALAFGYGPGGFPAQEAYQSWEFEFTPMKNRVGGRELIVFGLTNDQVGYILLPNDVYHFIQFGNEEINQGSSRAAENILEAFEELTGSVR